MGNNLPINGTETGRILHCQDCSPVCHYRCCDQSKPGDSDFGLDNAVLLYPGEWELTRDETRRHILITVEDFNAGKIGRCDRENFDQSQCDPTRNYKPLDCMTYPLTPTMHEGKLAFLIDPRCPLVQGNLQAHLERVRRRWEQVLASDTRVATWISSLKIKGYVPYIPSSEDGNS